VLKNVFSSATRTAAFVATVVVASAAHAQATPDALVRQISTEVIEAAKNDKAVQTGDLSKIISLVDTKVMPSVNFEVATRSAVGPKWREATPEQRTKLQTEFKVMLLRLYSGALSQLKDQTVEITKTLPVQGSTQVVVQSEVRGKGEPIKLDYRLDKAADAPAWKIMVQNYRSQFATELNKGGIDGLISALVERNKSPAPAKS